jgi:hypothetical protein
MITPPMPPPEELIQLMRTTPLSKVLAELTRTKKMWPDYYTTVARFFLRAASRK